MYNAQYTLRNLIYMQISRKCNLKIVLQILHICELYSNQIFCYYKHTDDL